MDVCPSGEDAEVELLQWTEVQPQIYASERLHSQCTFVLHQDQHYERCNMNNCCPEPVRDSLSQPVIENGCNAIRNYVR